VKKQVKKSKETASDEGKEVPYPLVPSKKDKECHLARFLDIFRKLEITMPFGEALQQMPLYSKFLNDMLTRKLSYPNFVRGLLFDDIQPLIGRFEILGTLCCTI